jgi:hypothetical protein
VIALANVTWSELLQFVSLLVSVVTLVVTLAQ